MGHSSRTVNLSLLSGVLDIVLGVVDLGENALRIRTENIVLATINYNQNTQ